MVDIPVVGLADMNLVVTGVADSGITGLGKAVVCTSVTGTVSVGNVVGRISIQGLVVVDMVVGLLDDNVGRTTGGNSEGWGDGCNIVGAVEDV